MRSNRSRNGSRSSRAGVQRGRNQRTRARTRAHNNNRLRSRRSRRSRVRRKKFSRIKRTDEAETGINVKKNNLSVTSANNSNNNPASTKNRRRLSFIQHQNKILPARRLSALNNSCGAIKNNIGSIKQIRRHSALAPSLLRHRQHPIKCKRRHSTFISDTNGPCINRSVLAFDPNKNKL